MENVETSAPESAEGMVQEGETKTTGFYNGKYNSISDFEKSHDELQKSYSQKTAEYKERMGAFTGAPEAYEPGEGIEIDDSNPLFNKLQEVGKDMNLDNEGFNKLVSMYNEAVTEQSAQYEETLKAEMVKLGDNANERIQNIADWSNANLSEDERGILDSLSTSAEAVQLIEKFIGMSKQQGIARDHQVQTRPSYDKEDIRKMQMATDDNGNRLMSVDPAYYKKVKDLMAQHA